MRAFLMVVLIGCSGGTPKPSETSRPRATVPFEPVALPDRPLRLGRPPNLAAQTRSEYEPLAGYLAAELGHPVEVVVPDTYDDVVQALVRGDLDLGMLTPFVYVKAKERLPELRLLVSVLGEGAPRYRGYIVTSIDRRLMTLRQLEKKRFGFVDRDSASGYLFPLALLREAGIEPERDFAAVVFAGSHGEVVKRVLAGELEAGAVSSTTFAHMRGEDVAQRLRIIAKTDWIPLDAVVAHPALGAGLADRVRGALLGLSLREPEARQILKGITTMNGFVPGDDTFYDPVRVVAARLGAGGAGGASGRPSTGADD